MATPEPAVISVDLPSGDGGIRVRWDPSSAAGEEAPEPGSPWELDSEPDWRLVEGVRLVSARFDDGRVLGLAAVRPREARGHGDDAVIARLLDSDGLEITTSDALMSVEYDAGGIPRRLGIELWPEAESAPLRVAGDRVAEAAEHTASDRKAVAMSFRLDAVPGSGLYEVLHPD